MPLPSRSAAAAAAGLRERNKRDKWTRIQRAARAIFSRDGFDAATLRAIATRAGVATGTLFLYARDKRALLFLVFQDESRRIFAEARADADADAPLVEALMRLFGRFLDFYAHDPALSAAILREFFFRPYEPDELGALTREYGALVGDFVMAARARGELRDDVPVAVASSALFAHYAYWVQAWLGSRLVSQEDAALRLRQALQLQIDGLRPRTKRPQPMEPRRTPRKPR